MLMKVAQDLTAALDAKTKKKKYQNAARSRDQRPTHSTIGRERAKTKRKREAAWV
jgi:hypothetical protein